jgi:hypothetical protein
VADALAEPAGGDLEAYTQRAFARPESALAVSQLIEGELVLLLTAGDLVLIAALADRGLATCGPPTAS